MPHPTTSAPIQLRQQPAADLNRHRQRRPGHRIRKFVDSLPGLGAACERSREVHPDRGARHHHLSRDRLLRDRAQAVYTEAAQGPPADGAPRLRPAQQGTDASGNNTIAPPCSQYYLGPMIVAQRNRPVRVKFINQLPTGTGGNLFLPVDTTIDGRGHRAQRRQERTRRTAPRCISTAASPRGSATARRTSGPRRRARQTSYPKGVSVQNVPDMPDRAPGTMTFFYTNQQSARLMFYPRPRLRHHPAERLRGRGRPYELQDPVEQELVTSGVIPADEIPLVIQDKTFVPDDTQLGARGPDVGQGRTGAAWATSGSRTSTCRTRTRATSPAPTPWAAGTTALVLAALTGLTHGPVANPYYDPVERRGSRRWTRHADPTHRARGVHGYAAGQRHRLPVPQGRSRRPTASGS